GTRRQTDGRRARRGAAVVFDPDTELARQVDSGLDRDRVAGCERRAIPAHQVRLFVAVHPQTVAEAVREEGAVPGVFNDLAGRTVHVLSGNTGRQRVDAGPLCAVDDRIDLAQLVGGCSEGNGPRHVGGIAADLAAGVDQDHVAGGEPAV